MVDLHQSGAFPFHYTPTERRSYGWLTQQGHQSSAQLHFHFVFRFSRRDATRPSLSPTKCTTLSKLIVWGWLLLPWLSYHFNETFNYTGKRRFCKQSKKNFFFFVILFKKCFHTLIKYHWIYCKYKLLNYHLSFIWRKIFFSLRTTSRSERGQLDGAGTRGK